RVGARQVFLVDDLDDPALQGGGGERLRLEHGGEREIPRLVLDLRADFAGHVLGDDDGATAERRESRDHFAEVRVVPRDRDAGRLRLVALARMGREVGVDRELGPARCGGRHAGSLTPMHPRLAPGVRLTPGHADPGRKSGVTGSQVLARPRGECRPLGTDFHSPPPRNPAPVIPGLAPGVSPSRNGTRAAMYFMALPPAWRAADSPAARNRTPAP